MAVALPDPYVVTSVEGRDVADGFGTQRDLEALAEAGGPPEAVHYVGDTVTGLGVVFQNSWVEFDTGGTTPNFTTATNRNAYFYRDRTRTFLGGAIKNGTVGGAGVPAFTLPVAYRPAQRKVLPVSANDAFGVIIVNVNGEVWVWVGSNAFVDLESVNFRHA